MPKQHSYPSDKIASFKADLAMISDHFNIVREIVEVATIHFAEVYLLPNISKEDEKTRQLQRRKFVDGTIGELVEPGFEVSQATGAEAVTRTLAHYQQYKVPPDTSSWYAKRLPGLVCLNTPDATVLISHILRINELKQRLYQTAQSLDKDVERRWEIIHNAIPGFCSSSAYRAVPFIVNASLCGELAAKGMSAESIVDEKAFTDLYSGLFNFEHRQAQRNFTQGELLARLESSRAFADAIPGMSTQVENEIAAVLKFDASTRFKQRRPIPATPIYKIRGHRPGSTKKSMESGIAHSPVMAINLERPRKVSRLESYTGRTITMHDADPENGPVIRRLHIYVK